MGDEKNIMHTGKKKKHQTDITGKYIPKKSAGTRRESINSLASTGLIQGGVVGVVIGFGTQWVLTKTD